MRRILFASSVVLAAGCAAPARLAPPPSAVVAEAEARRLSELESANEARLERIRQLEGQLALSRAEIAGLREPPLPSGETVRIGASASNGVSERWDAADQATSGPDESELGLDEDEGESSGPRPLLRLYGSPAVSFESGVIAADPRDATLPLPTPAGSAPTYAPPIPAPPSYAASTAQAPLPMQPRSRRSASEAVIRYRAALEHMQAHRLMEAAASFASFLEAYPAHPYADNARYWRGEVLYAMRRYPEALREFERMLRDHPRGNKVPDALLKIGLCHQRIGDGTRARAYFRRVRNEHPDSVAARLASEEDAS